MPDDEVPDECYTVCGALNLVEYANGKLDPEDAMFIEEHLETCRECQCELEFWKMLKEVLGEHAHEFLKKLSRGNA